MNTSRNKTQAITAAAIFLALLSCGEMPVDYAQNFVANRAPVITALWSNFPDGQTPLPNEVIEISCSATDPDEDPINARFSSGDGSFSGQAQSDDTFTATFIVGNDISGGQDVVVTITVADAKGLSSSESITLGKTSPGAQLTLISAAEQPIGRDECTPFTYKSNAPGYYQVIVLDDPDREYSSITPGERPPYFYHAEKDVQQTIQICGPIGEEPDSIKLNDSDPSDNEDRVFLIFKDSFGQESYLSHKYSVNILPVVTTTTISGNLNFTIHIAGTSAKGGGNVTHQGSFPVTARGLCWNTTGNPTVSDPKASDGSGTGVFSNVTLSPLTQNRTYFVRAYATNAEGTAYGNQISFHSGWTFGTILGGNLVFYNNGSGGGLASRTSDYTLITTWSNIDNVGAETSVLLGTGQQNTTKIVSQSGHEESAAQVCLDFGSGWFLPSKDELFLMYTNLHLKGHGDFATDWTYISSSEYSDKKAWYHQFSSSSCTTELKSYVGRVRAIRAF